MAIETKIFWTLSTKDGDMMLTVRQNGKEVKLADLPERTQEFIKQSIVVVDQGEITEWEND